MSAKMYLLAGAAGLAALVGVTSPAAAQYPGYGYGYGNTNTVGGVVGQILGYGRYPYGNYGYNQYGNQSTAIDQCARAVEARLNGGNGYYGYGNVPYGGRYGGYNDMAFQNGANDGYEKGVEDARKNRSFDPLRHDWYRSGDRHYESRYGSKDQYKNVYRDGFRSGYDRGFAEGRYR